MTLVGLAHWRVHRRMSQAVLADKSGLTQAGISQLERGLRSPTLRTVSRLSETLGVPSEWLWGLPQKAALTREQGDRIARAIVQAKFSSLPAGEHQLAWAAGSLMIQKLRAHHVPGRALYARSRWGTARRPIRVRQLYGDDPVRQVLHRVDALLAMRSDVP